MNSEILRTLNIFHLPGAVYSIQMLGISPKALSRVVGSAEEALEVVEEFERCNPIGIYFTPNPVRPDLRGSKYFPKNEDITDIHWLLIDVDPYRVSGISATHAELEACWRVLDSVRATLDAAGICETVIGFSGNGWQLSVPVLMGVTDGSIIHREILKGLNARCSDVLTQDEKEILKGGKNLSPPKAAVDTSCYDAKRIWPLYGTMKKKGICTEERPHRRTMIHGSPTKWHNIIAENNTSRLQILLSKWKWEEEARKNRPQTDQESYAQAAMRQEIEALQGAIPGERNNRLNKAAFALGQFIAVNLLPRHLVEEKLDEVAVQIGLTHTEAQATIRSGINAGMKEPRDLSRIGVRTAEPQTNGRHQTDPQPRTPSEDWETPIPLNTLPPAEIFPLFVFPPKIQRYLQENAWSTNTPIDFCAVPALVVTAAAIGNSRCLSLTASHHQVPVIFAAVVNRPGSGKSRAQDLVVEPLESLERLWYSEWEEQKRDWDAEEESIRGDRPTMKRCLCDDATGESLVKLLAENPRGLLQAKDELSALVTGLNQYRDGKGSDRQNYLKLWSSSKIVVDRKNQDGIPIVVRRPYLSIVGGIQPGVIDWLRGQTRNGLPPPDDGFLDRFLVTYPEEIPARGEDWREVSKEASSDWAYTINSLAHMEYVETSPGDWYSHPVHFSPEGKIAWKQHTTKHADEMNRIGFPDWLRGPWSKLVPGYAARLALVLHCMHNISADTPSQTVTAETVDRAFTLVNYFKSHVKRLRAAMGSDLRLAEASRILEWIKRKKITAFTRRDILRNLRGFTTPESIEIYLKLLCEHHHIRKEEIVSHRLYTPRYHTNPSVLLGGADNADSPLPRGDET